jgi:NAD(P)H-dependent FMN reductase
MEITQVKTILAIPGSLREGSFNHAILQYLGNLAPNAVDYVIYDDQAQLPHFDPGLDNENPPATVSELRKLLADFDGVIICSPEYAYGVPGSLKNLLDWTVGSGSLEGKPLALITASTGGEHAHAALKLRLKSALGASLSEGTASLIPYVRTKIDGKGNITDVDTQESLQKVFNNLICTIG